MKIFTYKSLSSAMLVVVLPLAMSCSSILGGGVSNDPAVAAQQREVRALEDDVNHAKRLRKEAEEREKAAENRLKAAKHELKALESEARNRQ